MSTIARATGYGSSGSSIAVVIAAVATGNTAAQNSTAIQTAITAAAAGRGYVSLPAGTYDHQGFTLPAAGSLTVRGAGRDRTILRNTHATNSSFTAAGTSGSGPYCPNWQLADLTLTTDATSGGRSGQIGLDISLASKFVVSNVEVRNHGVGVKHLSSWNCFYQSVHVTLCGTGWQFPTNVFATSCPIMIIDGSAWDCTTKAVEIQDLVESLTWLGGDFAGSAAGVTIDGTSARLISFVGVNFERIGGDDLIVGATTGPSTISLENCRFIRTTTGTRSVQYVRGSALNFRGCAWNNYTLGVRQETTAGSINFVGNATSSVTTFYDSNGTALANTSTMLSFPNLTARIAPDGPSTFSRSVYGFDGIGTKSLAGAGKTTILDADFLNTPLSGLIAVVRNTTDDSVKLGVRVNGTWRYVTLT